MEHPPITISDPKRGKLITCCLLIVVALFSATFLRGVFSSAETYRGIYETLDERQNNVLSLAFGSALISSAISALPDDTATALSTEFADFYTGFAFIVSALLLEKYLLTTIGFSFFAVIIPICCVLIIASLIADPHDPAHHKRQKTAKKLFAFGLVLFLMTPLSVFIGRQIDESYRASVEATIKSTEEATQEYEKTATTDTEEDEDEQDDNPLALVQRQESCVPWVDARHV